MSEIGYQNSDVGNRRSERGRRRTLSLVCVIFGFFLAIQTASAGGILPPPTPTPPPPSTAASPGGSSPAASPTSSVPTPTTAGGGAGGPVGFGTTLPEYVQNFYNWSIGAGVLLAVIVLMYAGYLMMTSSGDPQKTGFAKEIIVGALSGLALLAGAKLILNLLSV